MIFSQRTLRVRPLALALAGMALTWGGVTHVGAAAPATSCQTSPEAEAAAVQSTARAAAEEKLSQTAPLYRLMYTDIQYRINVGEARVQGDTARVVGSVHVQGKQRLSGRMMAETFQGVVLLNRNGCRWEATSYRQA